MDRDEREFFDAVYTDSFPILFKVVYRITADADAAEEVCHEAFLRFYQHSTRLSDTMQARYWLLRVGKNLAFNLAKRHGRERTANRKVWQEPARPSPSADHALLADETTRLVREAIDRLPQNLREVILLKEYGELSYAEIAHTLGISLSNVKVRVHRARERLARALEEGDVHIPE